MARPVIRGVAFAAAAAMLATLGVASAAQAATTDNLVIGYDSDPAPSGYDPVLYGNGQRLFFESMYDSLFYPNGKGGVTAGLASNPVQSNSDKTLTFTVRSGIKFTDGTVLTADVVKANLDRRSKSKEGLTSYTSFDKGGSNEITDVTVSGNNVVVTFAKAQDKAAKLFTEAAGSVVCAKGLTNAKWLETNPCGTGVYSLAKGTIKGNTYKLTQKAAHWNKVKFVYKSLTYKVLLDNQARANALIGKQVAVAIPAGRTADLLKTKGVSLIANGGSIYMLIFWNGGQNPAFKPAGAWKDKNVRLALSYGTDRKAFVTQLFKGDNATANLIPKGKPGYDAALDSAYAYNPTKAKALLEAADVKNLEMTIVTSAAEQSSMQALKAQWAKIGVTLNIKIAANTGEIFDAVGTEPFGPFEAKIDNLAGMSAGVFVNGFGNFAGTKNAAIQGALGAVFAGESPEKIRALNQALVNEAWVMPIKEGFQYLGFNSSAIKKPVLNGSGSIWPMLADIKPAK